MKEIVGKADAFARSEIEQYGLPSLLNYETSNEKGEQLARALDADVDLVRIGTRLMDIKLGQAFVEKKLDQHVVMGVEATRAFLNESAVDREVAEKILNCVAGHHGTTAWTCIEAQICAAADCYRFLQFHNWMVFFASLGKRGLPFEKVVAKAREKFEEKQGVLMMCHDVQQLCMEELSKDIALIQKILARLSQ